MSYSNFLLLVVVFTVMFLMLMPVFNALTVDVSSIKTIKALKKEKALLVYGAVLTVVLLFGTLCLVFNNFK